MSNINKFEILKQALNLNSNPIGVKLIYDRERNLTLNSNFKKANKSESYCEYVKRASEGEFLVINRMSPFTLYNAILGSCSKRVHLIRSSNNASLTLIKKDEFFS